MKDFRERVAVVTGAGSGIGRALAVRLARRGARLALSGRNLPSVAETAALCEQEGAQARAYELDVADRGAVVRHAEVVVSDFGGVNLVVNNAGVSLTASVEETTWEDFEWIMNVNFWGVAHGTKAFLPHLIASGDAHLANVSSMFGLAACPTQSAYNATKFGVRGYTEAVRQDMRLAGHRVGVSCVHPGMIQTPIARKARAGGDRDVAALAENFERLARTSADHAASRIIRGIERDKARILIGRDARGIDLMARLLGSGYQRLLLAAARRDPGLSR